MRALPFVLCLASGCMMLDNIAPEARLSDQVYEVNDHLRWGRVEVAAERVASAHRRTFRAQHRAWGRDIHLADVDVSRLEMVPGGAFATVSYSWIDERSMELRSTTVRQRWSSEGEGFVLAEESIVGGAPELLLDAPVIGELDEHGEVVPPADDGETSGDEASDSSS